MSDIHQSDHGSDHGTSQSSPPPAPVNVNTGAAMKDDPLRLSKLAKAVISAFEKPHALHMGRTIKVNPVVSKFAAWYEKLRNAMEYREDEVILRATIERILRRRLLLGGNAKTTAAPLTRELIWARYLSDESVGEDTVLRVEEVIDLYLQLRLAILAAHTFSDGTLNEWIYDLMSSHIEQVLSPNHDSQIMASFMFATLKENIQITDDTEQTRDAQVFLAIRKSFARDDRAFLRFHMFCQIFGTLKRSNLESIAKNFPAGFKEITTQLEYPRKDAILGYVKRQTAPYLILQSIFFQHKADLESFVAGDEFKSAVYRTCDDKYHSVSAKVRRAIVRSVAFILLTKLVFAFLIEGTYELFRYGEYQWGTMVINTGIPPLLMVIVGFLIRTPDQSNTDRIYTYLHNILTQEKPQLGDSLTITKAADEKGSMNTAFGIAWTCAFLLSFGSIIYVLYLLHFNVVSMGIFVFFLAIVSFLAYRISMTASIYRLGEQQGLLTPVIDFLFLPIVRVGRQLTEGISQINIIIFLFDFLIETPFKEAFAFSEQLFHFLHTKRDELG